jgi:hypothetical protein
MLQVGATGVEEIKREVQLFRVSRKAFLSGKATSVQIAITSVVECSIEAIDVLLFSRR